MSPISRRAALAMGFAAMPGSMLRAQAGADDDDRVQRGKTLRFPRDHGAHPGSRIEWWYITGSLGARDRRLRFGFQITFFRSRTGLADALPGRFAPRQLLFAHAAITDLDNRRHRHAARLQRWNGDSSRAAVHAARDDTRLAIGAWTLARASGAHILARIEAPESGLALALEFAPTQDLLLQGEAGWSRKGPLPEQASHYYSLPQLATTARVTLDGQPLRLEGRGWLDHEWSDSLLADAAVGWDWIGINLDDGSALTAFRLRRADDSALWAGGSFRAAGEATARIFAPAQVRFVPGRTWLSPLTGARYPVQWRVETPAGDFAVDALLDAQEVDSRTSTGAVYWEGLAELRDTAGRRVGLGYLEMTGRASALRL